MNEQSPYVSIVTPCYNAGKYIKETIESVISQSFTDWEMLIVDDCSTDNSAEIVKGYEANDSRVHYLCTPHNTGAPAIPRNLGIDNARGRFVALLDADDVWHPDKLKEQITLMHNKPCRICYTDGEMMNEEGKILRTMTKADWVDYKRTLKRNELSCSSVMFEKKLIGEQRFKNIPKEDFAFWIQLMKSTKVKAYNTGTVSYVYRLVGNSRSRNKVEILKQHWHVLRHEAKLNVFYAAYCFSCWIMRNLKKYYI